MNITNDQRNRSYESEEVQKATIDDIFAQADLDIQNQQEQLEHGNFKRRNFVKKTKRRLTGLFVTSLILIFIILVIAGAVTVKVGIEQMRLAAYNTLIDARNSVLAIDEEDMTVDEYYAKEFMNIITEEDIRIMVENATSLGEIYNLMQGENLSANKYLSPEKIAAVESLFEEYSKVKEESLSQLDPSEVESEEDVVEETIIDETIDQEFSENSDSNQ